MTEDTLIALLAALGVVGAASIGGIGVVFGFLWRRIGLLEARLERYTRRERALWAWARRCQDLYYRHRKDDAPDLPPIPTLDEE
ncbi:MULTISPECIES: hypothetical protein [unclassified Leucobacter]|uniref:hypothetical protein n=1 Tax=unclassified Leucobacter TaxID=2621730 RepID=UPI00062195F9|nr:hypothetical protein [Leucobacter sp. Ag1]KKI19673.1 hypothetical protein XM48_09415 [Leucobacter sp. Ag1]